MKSVLLFIVLALLLNRANGQFLGGFFNQKSTQTKYMLEQIAAFKVYAGYLNQGYNIVKDGTGLIGDLKNGEFSLHKGYFNSLAGVSPAVRKYPKVPAIYALQSEMADDQEAATRMLPALTPGQADQLRRTLSGIRASSALELDELLLILEDGNTEMTEDARLQAIDRIYSRVQQMYAYQKRLLKSTASLVQALQQKRIDNALYKKLN